MLLEIVREWAGIQNDAFAATGITPALTLEAVGPCGELPGTGKPLWHSRLGGATLTNTPATDILDGRQYVVVAASDSLFGFALQ